MKKRYKKFNIDRWTERKNAQYKKNSDMVWFMLKHPITWLVGAMIASVVIELLK